VLSDCSGNVGSVFSSEGVEVRRTVEGDKTDFVLHFDVYLVEEKSLVEGTKDLGYLSHILSIK